MAKSSPPDAPEPGALSINDARAARGEQPAVGDPVPLARWRDTVHAADEASAAPPQWGHWRYTGTRTDIVYTSVPVTPEPGDVVECWGPPGHDGCWDLTTDEVTRMPDNHRPDITEEQAAKLRGDVTTA